MENIPVSVREILGSQVCENRVRDKVTSLSPFPTANQSCLRNGVTSNPMTISVENYSVQEGAGERLCMVRA